MTRCGHVFRGWGSGRVNARRMREFRVLIREQKVKDLSFEKRDGSLIVRFNKVEGTVS